MEEFGFEITPATEGDLGGVQEFLSPFMDGRMLLRRTSLELQLLLKHSFKAVHQERIVGYCALEIYSKKLAEIQCLAVGNDFRRRGVGKELVRKCVERAQSEKVRELMAISSSDGMFKSCGFDYSLPNQKRALFIQP